MSGEEHFRRLERMYLSAPINRFFKPSITVGEGSAEIAMEMRADFHHAAGAVHGAVYFKALDDAAFFAANSLVTDCFVLTVAFNVYLTRPISEGRMRAIGRVVHRSRRLYLAESILYNGGSEEIGRGNGSFMPSSTRWTRRKELVVVSRDTAIDAG